MSYHDRTIFDDWSGLRVIPTHGIFEKIADKYDLELQAHKILGDDGDVRIAVIYDTTEKDFPTIFSRVVKRAKLQHGVGTLESVHLLQLVEDRKYFEIVCAQLKHLKPDVVICISRDAMQNLAPPAKFAGVNMLQLINRLHTIEWGDESFPTVVTLPDSDVLFRTDDGKIAKEAATRLGEWVYATATALRERNLYTIKMKDYKYETITNLKQFDKFMDRLWSETVVSIDTETDNLNRIVNRLGTIQFAFDGVKGYALPIHHPESPFTSKDIAYIYAELKAYFETGDTSVHIYANAKFDLLQMFREMKLQWYNHELWDIQAAEQQLDENRKFRSVKLINAASNKEVLSAYSLAQLALEYGTSAYLEGNMGKDERSNIFGQPLDHVCEYGCKDVVIPYQIYRFQLKEFESRGKMYHKLPHFTKTQISHMILALVEMESNGLPEDRIYLSKEVASGGAFVEAREKERNELYDMEGCKKANALLLKNRHGSDLFGRTNETWVFNIDDRDHQNLLFFNVLGLEALSVGKDGFPSVNKAFKDKYAPLDDSGKLMEEIAIPEVAAFRSYAELKHLYSAFMKGFYEKLLTNHDMRSTGRLVSDFVFLTIITGRLGARKPSLQQVPSRSKLAKAIKRQFIAPINQIFIKHDFASHEVRNGAIDAHDEGLIATYIDTLLKRREFRLLDSVTDEEEKKWQAVFDSLDLHRQNCTRWYGIKNPLDVPKPLRNKSKTVTFGTIYGMSAYRLSMALKISVEEAEELIDMLFESYPGLRDYIAETHEHGHKYLAVQSSIGRPRHLWGYLHTDFGVHGAMDRRGVNSKVQGLSSDEGCEGNYQVQRLRWELFRSQDLDLKYNICNMVHDSAENLSSIGHSPIGVYLSEHAYTTCVHNSYRENYGVDFPVGLEVDFDIGPNLADVKSWNYRPENLRKLVHSSIKWQQDNLGYKTDPIELKKFETNLEIIDSIRCDELHDMSDSAVSENMYLTRKIARKELWL